MALQLQHLNLGKVDGKHEYLVPINERDKVFFDAYLIPENIDTNRLNNSDIHFIEGFRGTGKTSLLRWYAENRRQAGSYAEFILFKSDLTEQQRIGLSVEAGMSWTDIESKNMEISQDFKSTWAWFIYHKIGEIIQQNGDLIGKGSENRFLELLGLNSDKIYNKVLGFLPKLEGAKVKIKGNFGFFEAELGGDFTKSGESGTTTLEALIRKLGTVFRELDVATPIYIFFDELEVFHQSEEQFKRDQRLVRDLVFTIGSLNDKFRSEKVPIHLIGAVRSEVIDNLGAIGQEVDRLVHDKGFSIVWHYKNRSLNHPLLQMIRHKIWASEGVHRVEKSTDPIETYLPARSSGQPIEAYLLDRSFYKPRDIVWRLTLAQKQFPTHTSFNEQIFHDTEIEYSSRIWDEIKYELSATYSASDIDVIEMLLSGANISFDLRDMEHRFRSAEEYSSNTRELSKKKSPREILSDLYRLGAIGNSFRAGSTGSEHRNRWAFRGDPNLLHDKKMTIHPALVKRLSAVAARKRGASNKKKQ